MKVAIMQPYFYPYLGYYQLISECDHFIFLDDVNFIKKGFIHRNFINISDERSQINLRIVKASQNKKINELAIADSTVDFTNKIEAHYKKSKYWNDLCKIIDNHKLEKTSSLSEFLININTYLISCFDIEVITSKSSDIKLDNLDLIGQEKIIELTKAVNGTDYINLPGGKILYDGQIFSENGLELNFIIPQLKLNGEIENSYSIVDAVANYGFDFLRNWFKKN